MGCAPFVVKVTVETRPHRRRRGLLQRVALLGLILGLCSACGEGESVRQTPPPLHLVSGCSPLVSGQCLTPFPNMWFEEEDASTATGLRVVFPDGTLPANTPPQDNSAHEAVRRLPESIEQTRRFLRVGGRVENTCDGACVFLP